jgi:hypothetical protein
MSNATATVLILHLVTGLLLVACAMMPGPGPVSRVMTLLAGLGIAGWGAWVFLFGGWHLVGYRMVALPILAVAVLLKSAVQAARRPDPVPYPPVRPLAPEPRHVGPPMPSTAGPVDPVLGHGNQPHDPWATLYASMAARSQEPGPRQEPGPKQEPGPGPHPSSDPRAW